MTRSSPHPFDAGDEQFQHGLSALQAGNLQEAERRLQAVARAQPNHVPALNLLGVVLGRLGRNVEALASFDRAVAVAPHSPEAWYGRAMTLLAIGRPQEAIASFDRVLAAKPDFTQAHLLRAKLLADLGRYDSALEAIDKLLAVAPGLAEAWLGRSNILFADKRYEAALAAADKAAAAKPDLAEAWHGRGNALAGLTRHDEALAAYDKALALNPNFGGAWHGRGNALNALKRYDDALAAYDKALALAPAMVEAWLGRGNVLNVFKRCKEALNAFDRAEAVFPNLAEVWLGRGNSFCELNRYNEALTAYEQALLLDSGLAEALVGCGNIFVLLKDPDKARVAYDRALTLKPDINYAKGDRLHVKLQLSDWTNLDAQISELDAAVTAEKSEIAPFQFLAISSSAADQLLCAKRFMADQPAFSAIWRGEIYAHDRIRLGYLSADFRTHPVAQLAINLFETHDRSRFETIGISYGADDGSELRHRIQSAFDHFIDVRELSDADVAAFIRRGEIDVLIDLTGLTRYSRSGILARRPAPIQVNFLGYPGTMGADWMDYIIADPTVIPKEYLRFYSERVVWLPDTYQVNDSKSRISERKPTRSECGLPEDSFVFCCFNNTFKINPGIFDIWTRLLAAKADSVLWLIETNSTSERNLRYEAEQRGISPDRLIFAPKMSLADHLARSAQADLFLDTMPYNAHTTGSDALWAGVPLLTCLGSTFASRVAASLVNAVGLDELVTHSLEEYETLALKLARDPVYLQALRARLARNRSTHPLFDTKLFTRHIEAAYSAMHERRQAGLEPDHIVVPRLTCGTTTL